MGGDVMTKIKLIFLASFPVIIYVLLIMLAYDLKSALPEDKPVPPAEVQIIQVTARAFCEYGFDAKGNDYGPGYVIVSDKGEIPPGSYLDIDLCGQAQVMAVSDNVPLFGVQEAWVRVDAD